MTENEAPASHEIEHPDSKYDNWTIKSWQVVTKLEDIPDWIKRYAESSIDTHVFFNFTRNEFEELNDWQRMLLKLYRHDLHKIIDYYEEYRVALCREMLLREKREKEKIAEDLPRHQSCSNNNTSPEQDLPEPSVPSSPGTSSPVKFKRFGNRCSSRNNSLELELGKRALHKNGTPLSSASPSSNRSSKPTSPILHHPSPSIDQPATGYPSPSPNRQVSYLSSIPITDTMPIQRNGIGRKARTKIGYVGGNENVDQNVIYTSDFPAPKHTRSASSRFSAAISDFPSPLLARSASDRPNRHSVHTSLLHGVCRESLSSFNTVDSDEVSTFSRDSAKRGSGRVITSPRPRRKGDTDADNITVIPEKKERRLKKLFTRAASFGRGKDKTKSRPGEAGTRKSRRDDFEKATPKETAV